MLIALCIFIVLSLFIVYCCISISSKMSKMEDELENEMEKYQELRRKGYTHEEAEKELLEAME